MWPPGLHAASSACGVCGGARKLVLQAYAPLRARERTLYLFACNSITCSADVAAWEAMRVVAVRRREEVTVAVEESSQRTSVDWSSGDEGANEREGESDEEDNDMEALLSLHRLKIESLEDGKEVSAARATKKTHREEGSRQGATVGKESGRGAGYDSGELCLSEAWIEVDYEPEVRADDTSRDVGVQKLIEKYSAQEKSLAVASEPEAWSPEQEPMDSEEMLATEKFGESVARAPGHVLRYNFGAEPLWPKFPAPSPASGDEKCWCGSNMVFEVQLLSTALYYLKVDQHVPPEQNVAGMNFASVCVYTCAADCTNNSISLFHNETFRVFRQAVRVQQDDW